MTASTCYAPYWFAFLWQYDMWAILGQPRVVLQLATTMAWFILACAMCLLKKGLSALGAVLFGIAACLVAAVLAGMQPPL